MKLAKVCMGALLAVCLFGVMAGAAAALPSFLELAAGVTGIEAAGGASEFETTEGARITATGVTAKGSAENDGSLNQVTLTFTGVSAIIIFPVGKCNSAGQAAGTVVIKSEYHLVFDSLSPLGVAVLFLIANQEFECAGQKIVVNGLQLCLVPGFGTLAEKHELVCEKEAKGKQKEKEYWNDAGAKVVTTLTSKLGAGAAVSSAQLGTATVTNVGQASAMIDG